MPGQPVLDWSSTLSPSSNADSCLKLVVAASSALWTFTSISKLYRELQRQHEEALQAQCAPKLYFIAIVVNPTRYGLHFLQHQESARHLKLAVGAAGAQSLSRSASTDQTAGADHAQGRKSESSQASKVIRWCAYG